jgi:predicted N-acetyltransferase YhbS
MITSEDDWVLEHIATTLGDTPRQRGHARVQDGATLLTTPAAHVPRACAGVTLAQPSLNQPFLTHAEQSAALGVTTHRVTPADYAGIGALHDTVFGPGALTRTAYRIREGLPFHSPYCRLAAHGPRLLAFIRFAPILIGGDGDALMLGPLAVHPDYANQGHARRLIGEGLDAARAGGVGLVILVGDRPYYGRLGFVPVPVGQITMPGPVDGSRVLAYELQPGALATRRGMVARSG